MTKRYLLFGGLLFHHGGWKDYVTSFTELENVFGYVAGHSELQWWEIVDTNTGKVIAES